MHFTKFSLLAFALTTCLIAPLAATTKVYKATKDKVNIRLDSTSLSKSIGTLSSQDTVKVIDKKYNWYKIKLPSRLNCWVSSNFIKNEKKDRGIVKANNLNIRSQPSLEGEILGSLNENDKIEIKNKKNGWLKISCYPYAYGWVHSKLLEKVTEKEEKVNPYKKIAELSQKGKNNPELISRFFAKAESGSLENSALYLDVLENIILEDSPKLPFYYLFQENKLSEDTAKKAYIFLKNHKGKNNIWVP
ncbi:MAG: SH3 domain-containing protein [Candidatus Omnitrophica bacterium]|nr:SH3 domain-containing protein [Candidatus Omnitrophota bacterium]MCF7876820.1 SH3 domain-containing protein [Candidatus Omnitrophota bacterium]MCF7878115.1 SH3 domain-containing protein [Candidatus Omnitrophota bacterium]MCF7892981.1 SH3 domain-containing protein [Candidatus Omnitrophota bacterium]